MKINILICSDDDTQLINETVDSVAKAQDIIINFEYEYNARLDNATDGE